MPDNSLKSAARQRRESRVSESLHQDASSETTVRLNVNLPASLHHAYRLKLMQEKTSMKDHLLKVIGDYVSN